MVWIIKLIFVARIVNTFFNVFIFNEIIRLLNENYYIPVLQAGYQPFLLSIN